MLLKKAPTLAVAGVLTCLFGLAASASAQTKAESTTPAGSCSKAVRVNGVDFEVVAAKDWRLPAEVYGNESALISLRITNRGDKDLSRKKGDADRF
jgi:hypothetical protein